MLSPTSVDLNAERYMLARDRADHFTQIFEPVIIRQAQVAGSDSQAINNRPEELYWRLDNWSGGEGLKVLTNPEDQIQRTQYDTSTDAVDVRVPGAIKLGFDVDSSMASTASGGVSGGPSLINAGGNPWAWFGKQAWELVAGTWTSRTTGAGATVNFGGVDGAGAFCYVAYGSTNGDIRRVASGSNAQVVAEAAEGILIANSRLYWLKDSVSSSVPKFEIRSTNATLQGTGLTPLPTLYSVQAGGSAIYGVPLGADILAGSQSTAEPAQIHIYDFGDSAGRLLAILPPGFTIHQTPVRAMCVQNQVLFIGGYIAGATGEPDLPQLFYMTEETFGTVGGKNGIRKGTSDKVRIVFADHEDGVIMGTKAGKVYRYDMATGGVSEFIGGVSGETNNVITGITFNNGVYYIATRSVESGATFNAEVFATLVTGTGKYRSTSTVTSPLWDLGTDALKLALTIEVETDALVADTSVDIQLVLDGTAVTTDAAGATMTHSVDGVTRKVFTLSNAATERTFRRAQIKIKLDTAATAVTPTVRRVTLRCLQVEKIRYYRCKIRLGDDQKLVGTHLRAATRYQTLQGLGTGSNYLVTFKPHYEASDSPYPELTSSSSVVQVENMQMDVEEKGSSAVVELLLKVVG